MDEELMHYGILGMKWGVRRTPEQLGHKKAQKALKAKGVLEKYKSKKSATINKMYDKSIRKVEEALEYDPKNKALRKQVNALKKLRAQDLAKVEQMSYTDVQNERAAIAKRRKETAVKVASGTVKAVGGATLWAAKMGLVGVRIYGTFKAAQVVGEMGMRAVEWLNSPEGQELINKGISTAGAFVTFGDKVAKVANPDLGQYLDAEKLADTAFNMAYSEGKKFVANNADIQNTLKTVDSAANAARRGAAKLDELDRKIRHSDLDNSMSHYGIIGMKWGVRRTPEQLGHAPRKEKREFRRGVRSDEKEYRRLRRNVTATQKDIITRSRMADRTQKNVDEAEKKYVKASSKFAIFPGGRKKKEALIRSTEKRLDKVLERHEPSENRKRQAYAQAKKAAEEFTAFVDKMNDKYGSENVKQIKKKNLTTGMLWWKRTYSTDAIKTGINLANLPGIGESVSAGIVNGIERQLRKELMDERLADYERKKYA